MSSRTQLEDGAALLELYTHEQLKQLQKSYSGLNIRREADRCVMWWNQMRGGAVRWRQTFNNWLTKGARHNATRVSRSSHQVDPVAKFRDAKRNQSRTRSPSLF